MGPIRKLALRTEVSGPSATPVHHLLQGWLAQNVVKFFYNLTLSLISITIVLRVLIPCLRLHQVPRFGSAIRGRLDLSLGQ